MKRTLSRLSLILVIVLVPIASATADSVIETDADGNVLEEITDDGSRTTYLYDDQGRLIAIHHPDDSFTEYYYDDEGIRHEIDPAS